MKSLLLLFLIRIVQLPHRILFYLLGFNVRVEGRIIKIQPVRFSGKGLIRFGCRSQIGIVTSPSILGQCYLECRNEGSLIEFKDDVIVNNNFTAIAESTFISIGNRVLIGPDVAIFDSDFHGIAVEDRNNHFAIKRSPVVIEDDVFISARVIILKGVHVGGGSIIAAGAVVTKDVPARTIVAGNPAVVVKHL